MLCSSRYVILLLPYAVSKIAARLFLRSLAGLPAFGRRLLYQLHERRGCLNIIELPSRLAVWNVSMPIYPGSMARDGGVERERRLLQVQAYFRDVK